MDRDKTTIDTTITTATTPKPQEIILDCGKNGIKVVPDYFLPRYAGDDKCFAVVDNTVYMRNTVTNRYSFLVRLYDRKI
jgi:hypothetical protein